MFQSNSSCLLHTPNIKGSRSRRVYCRVQLKYDGTRWRTGGELKGKLANELGSQYPSHYLRTRCIQHCYRWWAHLGCQQSTDLTLPAHVNGLVRFAKIWNVVSARVPSHFKHGLRAVLYAMLFMRLYKQCSRWKGVLGVNWNINLKNMHCLLTLHN
jgi:hypothetical protein